MTEPRHLQIARKYLGQHEISGNSDNPVIVGFLKIASGLDLHDETPWCAGFVGAVLKEAGLRGIPNDHLPLWARSYLSWGVPIAAPIPGCVVVYQRGQDISTGHVNFFVQRVGDLIEGLGGNQSDAVTITRIPAERVLGYRWPSDLPLPGSEPAPVREPIRVIPEGEVPPIPPPDIEFVDKPLATAASGPITIPELVGTAKSSKTLWSSIAAFVGSGGTGLLASINSPWAWVSFAFVVIALSIIFRERVLRYLDGRG